MKDTNDHNMGINGVTLVEMVVAIAVMTVALSAMLPLLPSTRNSWDTRQADAEVLQNARVLADHVHRHLATAASVVPVSSPADETGYASTDGISWSCIDSSYISMGTDVHIGLAVTSHYDGAPCTSELDNVCVSGSITTGYALVPETLNAPFDYWDRPSRWGTAQLTEHDDGTDDAQVLL